MDHTWYVICINLLVNHTLLYVPDLCNRQTFLDVREADPGKLITLTYLYTVNIVPWSIPTFLCLKKSWMRLWIGIGTVLQGSNQYQNCKYYSKVHFSNVVYKNVFDYNIKKHDLARTIVDVLVHQRLHQYQTSILQLQRHYYQICKTWKYTRYDR